MYWYVDSWRKQMSLHCLHLNPKRKKTIYHNHIMFLIKITLQLVEISHTPLKFYQQAMPHYLKLLLQWYSSHSLASTRKRPGVLLHPPTLSLHSVQEVHGERGLSGIKCPSVTTYLFPTHSNSSHLLVILGKLVLTLCQ